MFRDFAIVFLLLISYLITQALKEHTLYDFDSYKFVEICVMAQGMAFLCEYSIRTGKKNSILYLF